MAVEGDEYVKGDWISLKIVTGILSHQWETDAKVGASQIKGASRIPAGQSSLDH